MVESQYVAGRGPRRVGCGSPLADQMTRFPAKRPGPREAELDKQSGRS